MHIRRLQPDDAATYVVLRREMLREAPWAFAASEQNDRGCDESGVRASLAGDRFAIVGAFADRDAPSETAGGVLIGAVGLNRTHHEKLAHRVDVWGVYVTPRAQGLGVAGAMLRAAMDVARSWPGVDSLRLSVSVRATAARRVYEREGFIAWGVEPRCLSVGGEQIDEIHMMRRI